MHKIMALTPTVVSEPFCSFSFDIQEITLTFTFQNGGTRRKVH